MATASALQNPDSQSITTMTANKEQSAMTLIDSFIDSQLKIHGSNHQIPISSLQKFLISSNSPLGIVSYIGSNYKQMETFLLLRKHLWTLTQISDGYFIKKSTRRPLLRGLVKFIEMRSEKDEILGAAKVKDISSHIKDKFPMIKNELGRGFDGVLSFLLEYPHLFQKLRTTNQSKPDFQLFLSKAILVDDVIVFKDYLEPPSTTNTSKTDHMKIQGIGRITHYDPKGFYGFLRDDKTFELAYFALTTVHPSSIKADDIQTMKSSGQKFKYDAVISKDFVNGTARNKWRVVYMTPTDGWMDVAGGNSGSKIQDTERNQPSVPMESRFPTTKMKESVVPPPETQSIENDFMPNPSVNPKPAIPDPFKIAHKIRSGVQEDHLIDNDFLDQPLSSKIASHPFNENQQFQSPNLNTVPSANEFSHLKNPQRAPITESTISATPPSNIVRPRVPIASIPTAMPSIKPKMDHSPIGPIQISHPLPAIPAQSTSAIRNSKGIKKWPVEKRDVACQTDPTNDWSLLIRLLGNSPDLLKLVRVLRNEGP